MSALTLILIIRTTGLLYAELDGLQVMENIYHRPTGGDMRADLIMILTNSHGDTRERSITQFSLDTNGFICRHSGG